MAISPISESDTKAKEIARYKQFTNWTFLAAFIFGSILLGASQIFNVPSIGFAGTVVLSYDVCLFVARIAVQRGQIHTAVMVSSVGLLVAALLLALSLPIAIPAVSALPLMAIAHALPYLPRREVRVLIFVSWFIAVIVVAFELFFPATIMLPTWFSIAFRISSFGAVLSIVFLLLWQFASRLTNMLEQTRAANTNLETYAAQLNVANEEIKQFASIVSHDLRAPLLNIRGFSKELRYELDKVNKLAASESRSTSERAQELSAALQQDIPEALEFIDSSVIRMDSYLNALLRLSRLGHRELKLENIDVENLVKETLKTLGYKIETAAVQIEINPLPRIYADRLSLEQIFGNILTNAVNYLEPSRRGKITISAQSEPDEFIFSITDNGRGIAAADYQKVFAPLRRAGKQDVLGEGMGLAYVQTLVRLHSGNIWFESQLDVGTTFFFTISRSLNEGDKDGQTDSPRHNFIG